MVRRIPGLCIEHSITDNQNRLKSPSGRRLDTEELNRIKQQALEAEKRYKRRLKAVVRIQRFWRKNRENATQKRLEWTAMQEMRRVQESYDREYFKNNLRKQQEEVSLLSDTKSKYSVNILKGIRIPAMPICDSPGK